ncbi:hypothetical protein [Zoogloea sp.]|uniref:hypothetical protein n=1 Tax=Zoogloea sp. TaxID=49181 RepID=UPI00260F57FC|nr:hypothetical protein [Zoogloea sp.]MDD3355112.1 hypothetical protein [Zoogloea sp.]
MPSVVHVPLNTSPEQSLRLEALQVAFAEVCNALAPVVQETRCWNRVGLHHLAYRHLRERFPKVGSQMVCNAIYSVSRTCRLVFQHPASPFNVSRFPDKGLPLLRFQPSAPVYFDRHTLSIRGSQLSMYTLDGRMRFQLDLAEADIQRFTTHKLREIALARVNDAFRLSFVLSGETPEAEEGGAELAVTGEMPEYIRIDPNVDVPHAAGIDIPVQRSSLTL